MTENLHLIMQYGKTIGLVYYDPTNYDHVKIHDFFVSKGCTVTTLKNNSEISHNDIETIVYVFMPHEVSPGIYSQCNGIPTWATLFSFIPLYNPCFGNRGYLSSTEAFYLENNEWVPHTTYLDHNFQHSTIKKQHTDQNTEKSFDEWLLGIHPELITVFDRCVLVYAGTEYNHAIERLPIREIVEYIYDEMEKGKDKIFFINADEALMPSVIAKCHAVIDLLDMPMDSVFHVTGTLNGSQSYDNVCSKLNAKKRMKIVSGYRFENVVKNSMGSPEFPTECCPTILQEYKIGPRNKLLTCFNRMPRWHRAKIVGMLFENNLMHRCNVSFSLHPDDTDAGWSRLEAWSEEHNFAGLLEGAFETDDWKKHIGAISKNWNSLPLVINRTVERDNPVNIVDEDKPWHDNSYFSVVNETNFYHTLNRPIPPISMFHTDGVFISEKLYKPLAYKHPFIVVGLPKTLEYIKRCGYQTFEGIFDESYDNIKDDHKRMDALIEQILELSTWSDEKWIGLQPRIKEIVEHNCAWLIKNKKLSTTDFDLLGQFNG